MTAWSLLTAFWEFLGWRVGAGDLPAPACLWLPAQSMNLANLGFSSPVPKYIDLMWQLTCGDQPSFLSSTGSTLHEIFGKWRWDLHYSNTIKHETSLLLEINSISEIFFPLATLTHKIVCVFLLVYHFFLLLLSWFCLIAIPLNYSWEFEILFMVMHREGSCL